MHPLPRLPRLRVVPFLGLAVVHRRGALPLPRHQRGQGMTSIGRGLHMERLTAGSTAAARKCLLITRKIIIPPPDSGDPPDGPPYFTKKMIRPLTAGTHELHLRTQGSAFEKKRFAPLTAGTHQLHLRTQGSASKKIDSPHDYWDPPATPSHARKCL